MSFLVKRCRLDPCTELTAISYTPLQSVLAVAILPEKLSVSYVTAWVTGLLAHGLVTKLSFVTFELDYVNICSIFRGIVSQVLFRGFISRPVQTGHRRCGFFLLLLIISAVTFVINKGRSTCRLVEVTANSN